MRQPGAAEAIERGDGFGHLHQGEEAFVHPGPARGVDGKHGQPLLGGPLHGAGELFAPDRAHAGAHERELGDRHHDRPAIDPAGTRDQRFSFARFLLGADELVGVGALGFDELEGILRLDAAVPLLERAVIGEQRDPLAGVEPEMMAALRADAIVVVEFFRIDELATFGALDPHVFGDRGIAGCLFRGTRAKLALSLEKATHAPALAALA